MENTVASSGATKLSFKKLPDPNLRRDAIFAAKIMAIVDYHYRLRSQSPDKTYPYTIREMMKELCADCGMLLTSYACLNGIQAKNILVTCINTYVSSVDEESEAQKEIEDCVRSTVTTLAEKFPATKK